MLFNSYEFIFIYLPLVLLGFFQLARFGHSLAAGWLAAASLFFYGYWNPAYVGLLLASISVNYTFGMWIVKAGVNGQAARRRGLLSVAISANLFLLGYYKYANFFLSSMNTLTGIHWPLSEIVLPLGISFFTFTQIAFLVDTFQGKVKEYNFVHYVLFVTYFPHLIAGPVLHHKEMMPQFAKKSTYRFNYENMAVGLTIFFIGLFKKVVIADGVAVNVAPVFDAPAMGATLNFAEAWGGALCYSLQLYFDFSGYSDMAIGLSRMSGVLLPLNFNSPYKAVNIIEFWRRWHMTLSRFLRDYLYIPLGGSRKGSMRRYLNLTVTMLLGGLWHGAGWTFVIWGGLHGAFLVINHAWLALRHALGQDPCQPLSKHMHVLSVIVTFLAVTVAWVFFRADTLDHALVIVHSMFSFKILAPEGFLGGYKTLGPWLALHRITFAGDSLLSRDAWHWIWILLLLVWFTPNTQQIMAGFKPALDISNQVDPRTSRIEWKPSILFSFVTAILACIALVNVTHVSEFLYFRF